MSRIYEALQQSAKASPGGIPGFDAQVNLPENSDQVVELPAVGSPASELEEVSTFTLVPQEENRLVVAREPSGLASEKVRILITRLRHIQRRRPFRKILITSTIRGEGKSMLSANLAIALARQNQRTLLIDGDLRRPNLDRLLKVAAEPGLCNWWAKPGPISQFLRRLEGSPLWVLPSGGILEQPAGLLQSARLAQLLAAMGQLFEWVIIDSPPVGPIADAGNWTPLADAILLVVRSQTTPKKLLERSLDMLDRSKIVGIVMNGAQCAEQKYYRGYYGTTPPSSDSV